MDTLKRRKELEDILMESDYPIKGSQLASKLGVSRQVIVQDIAILRAKGLNIFATPQGYIMYKDSKKLIKTISCKNHESIHEIDDELGIIVDMGGKVIDITVEHPIYGEIKGMLNISSKRDINEFLYKLRQTKSSGLSSLTNGVHIHTIEVKDEGTFNEIIKILKEKNILLT
ncbi:MAG TPA: transcription repressor NadR [Peptostreptococcaceae bacterium]|nr:transcription repressor NadR [Peptostreptococcaceae bacterium]